VEKVRGAGVLYGGREPGRGSLEPLGSRGRVFVRRRYSKGGKGEERREAFPEDTWRESPRGQKAQESRGLGPA